MDKFSPCKAHLLLYIYWAMAAYHIDKMHFEICSSVGGLESEMKLDDTQITVPMLAFPFFFFF